jgi:hypothetical protein
MMSIGLIRLGADPGNTDSHGNTCLHLLTQLNNIEHDVYSAVRDDLFFNAPLTSLYMILKTNKNKDGLTPEKALEKSYRSRKSHERVDSLFSDIRSHYRSYCAEQKIIGNIKSISTFLGGLFKPAPSDSVNNAASINDDSNDSEIELELDSSCSL